MRPYQLLSGNSPPNNQCPKVVRPAAKRIVVVGVLVTDPEALAALGVGAGEAAVEITETLYREGVHALDDDSGEEKAA